MPNALLSAPCANSRSRSALRSSKAALALSRGLEDVLSRLASARQFRSLREYSAA